MCLFSEYDPVDTGSKCISTQTEACFVNLQFNCLKATSISVVLTIWKSCYLHQHLTSCIGAKEGETSGHLRLDVQIGVYVVLDIGGKRKKLYLSSIFLEGVWKYQIKFTGVFLGTRQAQSDMVQELMWQELQGHNLGHSSAAPRGLAPHYSNFIISIKEAICPKWARWILVFFWMGSLPFFCWSPLQAHPQLEDGAIISHALSPGATPAKRSFSFHTSIFLTPVFKLRSCISIYFSKSVKRIQISLHYF